MTTTDQSLFDEPPAKKRASKPDPLWDAVCLLFYPSGVPTGQTKYVNGLVRDLRELGATPESLRRRVAAWHPVFSASCVCTLQGVVRQWDRLKPQKPKCTPGIDPENDAGYQRRLKEWTES